MHLKDVLRQIEPMMLTSSVDASPLVAVLSPTTLAHRCRRTGVHPIGVQSASIDTRLYLRERGRETPPRHSTFCCKARAPGPTGRGESERRSREQLDRSLMLAVNSRRALATASSSARFRGSKPSSTARLP